MRPEDFPDASPTTFLPPHMYVDAWVYDAEQRHVFAKSWQLVADVGQLTAPGDYLADTIGTQPIIIVRDKQLRLRCFANVCRHRGCTLLEGRGNAGRGLVCPYHQWSYSLNGDLVGVPFRGEFEFDLDVAGLGLIELRMAVWERFAFVDLSGSAPPLADYLGEFAAELSSHNIEGMRALNVIDEELEGNWKVHVDNAFCAYHFAMVHPQTLYAAQSRTGLTVELAEFAGCSYIPWKGYEDGTAGYAGLTGRAATGSLNISLFPNVFLGALPSGRLTVLAWTPTSVERTRLRAWSFGHATDEEAAAEPARQRRVLAEDFEVVRRTWQGMRSPLYRRPGPRHYRELRIYNFHRMLVKMLKDGAGAATRQHSG
ncbi:aromatic ring-hydroxylating dioxygenase subunit alpha [Dactylosporangium roseum]|uniref:Aromatic ring-hydroxylating dioxygenase subunit alpha n=1 Tax=Dactylosporangium roseum TaxID=47989 RepID=A0ABY5ZCX7_9ACTN|nr:aromatic ring-hydroxylating dioxygenase subunit alpha [Dactylosporangium roseum]UWZ39514.1 aromatic ring-hydroxylating dioxygenase subunit alpha [Dactylosporangium roseum]